MTEFEGAPVAKFEGKVPSVTVDMSQDYRHGSIIRAAIELRVKSVRYEEQRDGSMARVHVFAVESLDVVAAFNAADDQTVVGGSARGNINQDAEDDGDGPDAYTDPDKNSHDLDEELPGNTNQPLDTASLEFGRTSERWPGDVGATNHAASSVPKPENLYEDQRDPSDERDTFNLLDFAGGER